MEKTHEAGTQRTKWRKEFLNLPERVSERITMKSHEATPEAGVFRVSAEE